MKKMIVTIGALALAVPAFAGENCMRGDPRPMFPNADMAAHTFSSQSPTEATETIHLRSGAMVRITHGGCEYYVQTIEFDLPAAKPAVDFRKAANLLKHLLAYKPDTVFDLGKAARTLGAAARKMHALGQELPVNGDGEDFLQTRVMLEREGTTLKIVLFKGPL